MTGVCALAALVFVCIVPAAAGVTPVMTGPQAYAEFTRLKNEARAISKRHDPSTVADCREAAPLVRRGYDFLARPDVAELRTDLLDRLSDQHKDLDADLAECAVVAGDLEVALPLLARSDSASLFDVQDNAAFDRLKADPRFRAMVERERREAESAHRLWDATALATPFNERLTTEEKVAGLSLFWATVRQDFAYIDRLRDVDWNAVYLDYLRRVMAAETTEDYYRVMMQLAPLLHDGHTNVYPPSEIASRFFARPPIRTALIDRKVVVTHVRSAGVARRLAVGDEIVAVDGMPVQGYANEHVKPFVSASTPQDFDVRMYDDQLLSGDATKSVRLGVATANGSVTVDLSRSGYTDIEPPPERRFRMLPGRIAYLPIPSFESDAAVRELVEHLSDIRGSAGLILDVRDNGGGDSKFGTALLSYLTRQPIPIGSVSMRADPALLRAYGRFDLHYLPAPGNRDSVSTPHPEVYDGPVALLIGPRTFSAAEDFVMQFDAIARGRMYGSRTAGSSGQPLMMWLPGGGSARVCVKREAYPDGREFVGKGIEPAVTVIASVDDVRRGLDPVLDRAANELRRAP